MLELRVAGRLVGSHSREGVAVAAIQSFVVFVERLGVPGTV